jgi:protein TonB
VSVAALIAAAVFGLGPYGLMHERPPVCAEGSNCVIVMGLDNDVTILFGNPNQLIDFDLNDEVTRRLVGWLGDAPGAITVYKYPAEIEIPERGVPGYADRAARAIARASEIGRRYNASLVVIGQVVSDRSVALAYIDPQAPPAALQLSEYELPVVGAPPRFATDYAAHIAGIGQPPAQQAPSGTEAAASVAHPPAPSAPQAAPEQAPPQLVSSAAPPPSRAAPPSRTTAPARTQMAAATAPRASSTRSAAEPSRYTPPYYAPPPAQIVQAQLISDPQAAVRLAASYPQDAMRAHATGDVDVRCMVNVDGSLRDCAVVRNTNPTYSFARVALEHAQTRRATPETIDGAATDDGVVLIPYRFAVQ